jgi:hypothetical protein
MAPRLANLPRCPPAERVQQTSAADALDEERLDERAVSIRRFSGST